MKPTLAAIAAARPGRGRKTVKPSRDDLVRHAQVMQSEFNTVTAIEYLQSHDVEVEVIRATLLLAGVD